MQRRRLLLLKWTLSFLAVPVTAYADAGTALVWALFIHLGVGNLLIGILEGWLIARVFNTDEASSIAFMIPANFVSLLLGLPILHLLNGRLTRSVIGATPLYDMPRLLLLLAIFSFFITLVLEWPFCLLALRGCKRLLRSSLRATLIAQTVSYALLVPFYWYANKNNLYLQTHVDRTLSFAAKLPATIYFIGSQDGDIYRISLNGTGLRKVCELGNRKHNAKLYARQENDTRSWDLWLGEGTGRGEGTLVFKGIAERATASWRAPDGRKQVGPNNDGPAADLRPAPRDDWGGGAGSWADGGLSLANAKTHANLHLLFETPFARWHISSATILPGDQVVFQLDDQIVLLDLPTRKLGLITRGRGPVVLLEAPGKIPLPVE